MNRLHLLAACAFLALPAFPQAALTCTGKVVKAPLNPCDPAATHKIDCTDVLLKSSTVSLSASEGKVVDLTGTATVGACNVIDVASVAAAPYTHTLSAANQFKLGTNVTFRGTGPFAGYLGILVTGGSGFVPAANFGAVFVDLSNYVLLGPTLSLLGSYSVTATIPNNAGLIGGMIWSQSFWVNLLATPVTGALVNAQCFKIIS